MRGVDRVEHARESADDAGRRSRVALERALVGVEMDDGVLQRKLDDAVALVEVAPMSSIALARSLRARRRNSASFAAPVAVRRASQDRFTMTPRRSSVPS